jgi:hypothetical protein
MNRLALLSIIQDSGSMHNASSVPPGRVRGFLERHRFLLAFAVLSTLMGTTSVGMASWARAQPCWG